jgi:hypothetical protein
MSIASLVDKGLLTAFAQVKELAVDIVITIAASQSFDFNTAAATVSTLPDVHAKAIIMKERTLEDGSKSLKLLIKAENIKFYDTVLIGDVTWKIAKYIQSNKHTTVLEVYANV